MNPEPADDATPVLEVRDLVKVFAGFTALDGVSFHVDRNEVVGLLGVNGAGKTTAMNVILGLTTPTRGGVRAFGLDFAPNRIRILRRCNFSSAYASLPSNLRVWQNLYVFARIYGVRDPRRRIDELLDLLEIPHLRNHVTGHLSAGESTRVNLCKALLNQPTLLMLDEPTASLDPDIADKVRTLVKRYQIQENAAVLYTSHNMKDVELICDRVLFLHHGRIIAKGTPAEVVRQFNEKSLEDVFIRVARDGEMKEVGTAAAEAGPASSGGRTD